MATILDGKVLAAKCKEAVKKEAESLQRKPGLAVIIVGNNPASRVYVNSKRKDCEDCGFLSEEYAMPEETTQAELIALIETLNGREDIDGILCQLPLPKGIDEEAVLMAISPEKDVDGFHPMNMGSLLIGKEGFLPYRGQAHGSAVTPEARYGGNLPFSHEKPGRGLPECRYFGGRSRQSESHHSRYGETRCRGH